MEVNGLPIVKLGEILPTSYKNGIYKNSESYGSGTPILRITDFDNDGNLVNGELRRLELSPKEIKGYQLQRDDIVVNRVNSLTHLGKSVLWRNEREKEVVYESNMMRIEPNPLVILPEFVIRVLQSHNARSHFRKVAKRAVAQCSISQQDVKSLKFPLPPLPEQKKIAQILSTWDQAITATERLLANSQQRKKGLMQQLLTGKKRLPGFEGDFKEITLNAAATITMGTSPKSAAYNSIGDGLPLLQGNADIEGRRSKPRVYTSEITKACQPDDILLSVRAPVGSVAISNHEACIGRGICAIKAKNKNDQEFLYQWMLWYEPRWASLSQGSTFESVNSSDIKNLKIKLPEPGEQRAISNVLSVADRESELLESKLDQLKNEKKALMQQLLTGKRRVNVETEAA